MLFKTTTKLFKGIYQYKLVVVCAGASWFRGGDMTSVLNNLNKIDIHKVDKTPFYRGKSNITNQDELDYAFKLQSYLSKLKDIEVRVETPWISIYTNSKADVDSLIKLDSSKIKYICSPPAKTILQENTVIMPKIKYDYKITLGKTTSDQATFVAWAENNSKIKLTKSCKRELSRDRSWGGSHFYVTGDNNLLMAKMHLGGCINKVERIIKV
jgi:hypothetical protein